MAEAQAKEQGALVGEAAARDMVQYRVEDGIALLTLNDPPANTYSYEMMQQLDRAILNARMDDSAQVIFITGSGEKFFSAGANIRLLSEMTPTFKYYFCLHANETLARLEQTPKLVVAAINGHCVGGGLEVAMAADIRIARKGAGKMGLPEVTLGVLPGTGGTQRLVRLVGKAKAIELMAAGELFDFEQAAAWGIISELYEADSSAAFMEQALAYARKFTLPDKATLAVGLIKRSVQTGAEIPFESALALERELQQQLFQSEDAREGISAYVEKRKPQFTGK